MMMGAGGIFGGRLFQSCAMQIYNGGRTIERKERWQSKSRTGLTEFERLRLLCPADGPVPVPLGVSS